MGQAGAMTRVRNSAFLLCLLSGVFPANAAPDPECQSENDTFTFHFENDLFSTTDRAYTNGIRVLWTFPEKEVHSGLLRNAVDMLAHLPRFAEQDGRTRRVGIALGQNMYTPSEEFRERTNPIPEDRPFAGWLYGAVSIQAEDTCFDSGKPALQDTIELNVGVVGPAALARQAQDLIHDIRGITKFKGWKHQLNNEPGLLLRVGRRWRYPGKPLKLGDGLELDFISHWGGTVGNVLTAVDGGIAMRAGLLLPRDFGIPTIGAIMGPSTSVPYRGGNRYSVYVFAAVDSRVVAHNIFLDGNTFSDSQRKAKKTVVSDWAVGLAAHINRVSIAYTFVRRSREFEGEERFHEFGSVRFAYAF